MAGEVPYDLLKTARDLSGTLLLEAEVGEHTGNSFAVWQEIMIARALLAERVRCAAIAEMHDHRGDIAAAIRKPSP